MFLSLYPWLCMQPTLGLHLCLLQVNVLLLVLVVVVVVVVVVVGVVVSQTPITFIICLNSLALMIIIVFIHTWYLSSISPIYLWRKIGHAEKLQILIPDRYREIWNSSTCRGISNFPLNRCEEMWNFAKLGGIGFTLFFAKSVL